MKALLFSFLLLLVSCGTGVSKSHQAGGKQVYKAKCNGGLRDISSCHEQASEQCGGKYKVFGQEKTSTGAMMMEGSNNMIVGVKRILMFTCE